MAALMQTFVGAGSAVHTFGTDTVIVTISTSITAEVLWASITAGRALSRLHGQPIAALTIIEHGAGVPGPELRKEITRVVDESRAFTRCAAQVLRGQGFWLSAVRSLLTAIELIRPGDLPRRVFDDVTPASRWMAGHLQRDRAWADQLAGALRTVSQPSAMLAAP
jgi:hypothetical protein